MHIQHPSAKDDPETHYQSTYSTLIHIQDSARSDIRTDCLLSKDQLPLPNSSDKAPQRVDSAARPMSDIDRDRSPRGLETHVLLLNQ